MNTSILSKPENRSQRLFFPYNKPIQTFSLFVIYTITWY